MSTNPLTKLDEPTLKAFGQNLQHLVEHHERAEVLMHKMLAQVFYRQLDVEQEKAKGTPKLAAKWVEIKDDFGAFRQQYPGRNPVHFFATAARVERLKSKYAPIDLALFVAPPAEKAEVNEFKPLAEPSSTPTPPRRRP